MISAIRIGRMPEQNKATLKRALLAELRARAETKETIVTVPRGG
jgi:hypothetical protein